jgi:hypothetical protein
MERCSDAPEAEEVSEPRLVANGEPAETATDDAAKEDTSVLKLKVPDANDEPDARPSAEASEVDAQPIGWSGSRRPTVPLSVPTDRGSLAYDLAGCKRVLVFNQKNFAPRLKLNTRNGTEVHLALLHWTRMDLGGCPVDRVDLQVAGLGCGHLHRQHRRPDTGHYPQAGF